MAEARDHAAWDHTATLLCLMFNVNRGPKTRPAKLEDFHPYRKSKRDTLTVEALHGMRAMFEAPR